MKNLILLLSIFFTSINFCFAQKITVDRLEDNGSRQVMCSSKDEKLDGVKTNKKIPKKVKIIYVLVNFFGKIDKSISFFLQNKINKIDIIIIEIIDTMESTKLVLSQNSNIKLSKQFNKTCKIINTNIILNREPILLLSLIDLFIDTHLFNN